MEAVPGAKTTLVPVACPFRFISFIAWVTPEAKVKVLEGIIHFKVPSTSKASAKVVFPSMVRLLKG